MDRLTLEPVSTTVTKTFRVKNVAELMLVLKQMNGDVKFDGEVKWSESAENGQKLEIYTDCDFV